MSKRICSFCGQKVADHKGPTGIRCSLNTNYDFTFLKMPETKQLAIVTTRPFSLPCYLQVSENGRVVTIEQLGEDELSSTPFQKGAKLENSDITESAITSSTAKTPKQSLSETVGIRRRKSENTR